MEFRLLGTLEVLDGDAPVGIGGGKRRSLLALLLLRAGEVISAERLIDELWGSRAPPTAAKSLQGYVSLLRRELAGRNGSGTGVLLTRGAGYLVQIDPEDLDISRFERCVAEGRRALESGDMVMASERLQGALATWRGPALADFAYQSFAQPEIARLDELRLVALESRAEAELGRGRHAELIGDLEPLVREHPFREGLRGHLMLALYRAGRQAEALDAYRQGRAQLVSELGLEPGPALRELEARILEQSPQLAPPALATAEPPAPVSTPRVPSRARGRLRSRTLRLAVLGAVASLSVGVYAAVFRRSDDGERPTAALDLAPNSIAAVDPASGAVRLALPLMGRPTAVAAAGSMLWATTVDSASLTEIDARTRRITRAVPLSMTPASVAVDHGVVWVLDGRRDALVAVKKGYGELSAAISLRRGHRPARRSSDAMSVAVGMGSLWVTDGSSTLTRVDPGTRRVKAIPVGRSLRDVAVGAGAVWAISARTPSVMRVDPRTNAITDRVRIARAGEAAPSPAGIAATADAVWVLNRNTATVTRIDSSTRGIAAVIPIGAERAPNAIAAADGNVWVANDDGTLSRIDASTNTVTSVRVGESLRQVSVDGGQVWVAAMALDQQRAGGTE
jgi:DNA-binding SARP family transcriptional activator